MNLVNPIEIIFEIMGFSNAKTFFNFYSYFKRV